MDLELHFKCDTCDREDECVQASINLQGWEANGLEDRISSNTDGGSSTVTMKCPDCINIVHQRLVLSARKRNEQLMNQDGYSVTERMAILYKEFPELTFDLEIT